MQTKFIAGLIKYTGWLGFMAYQPLLVIYSQIIFYIYIEYMICKQIL